MVFFRSSELRGRIHILLFAPEGNVCPGSATQHELSNKYNEKRDKNDPRYTQTTQKELHKKIESYIEEPTTSYKPTKNESKNIESYDIANLLAIKKWFNGISFIFGIDFNQKQSSLEDNNDENWVELILSIREKLRQNKQYDLSDEIRDELNKRGIEVSDS